MPTVKNQAELQQQIIDVMVDNVAEEVLISAVRTMMQDQMISVDDRAAVNARLAELEDEPPFTVFQPSDLDEFKTGNTITLPRGEYNFTQNMNFGIVNIVTLGECVKFSGVCLPTLTYEGTGPFVSSVSADAIIQIDDIFIIASDAIAIKMTGGSSLILNQAVFLSCLQACELDAMDFLTINTCAIINCDNGIVSNNTKVATVRLPQFNNGQDVSGKYLTCTGALSESLVMSTLDVAPENTESFLDIQASYGGGISIGLGVHKIAAGGSFFSSTGRDQNDVEIQVSNVVNVTPSKSTAAIHIAPGDELATSVIQDTEVILAGTFTEDVAQRYETNAAGRITYKGKEAIIANFSVKFLGTPASGTNKNYDFYVRVNGTTLIDISFDTIKADSGSPSKANLVGGVAIVTDDYFEIVIIGRSPTPTDLTCEALSFIVA